MGEASSPRPRTSIHARLYRHPGHACRHTPRMATMIAAVNLGTETCISRGHQADVATTTTSLVDHAANIQDFEILERGNTIGDKSTVS